MKIEKLSLYLLVLVAVFPLCLGLNSVGLFEREETRYAEMAREMLQTGDWLVPRLLNYPYLEKPPLTVWVTAISFQIFGIHDWSARVTSLIGALLLLFFTFRMAHRIGGISLALNSLALLASFPLFFALSRILSTDTLFAGFIFAALDFLFLVSNNRSASNQIGLAIFTAGAFLCKGPIALVVIGLGSLCIALVEKSYRKLFVFFQPTVFIAFLALVLPWFICIAQRYPSYWHYYIVEQHWERFLPLRTENKDMHAEPFWYFFPVLLGGFFPTVFFISIAWRRSTCSTTKSLWLWAACVFVFFSIASGKRIPYLLPIAPAIAIGLAIWFSQSRYFTAFYYSVLSLSIVEGILVLAVLPQFDSQLSLRPILSQVKEKVSQDSIVLSCPHYFPGLSFYGFPKIQILGSPHEIDFGMTLEEERDSPLFPESLVQKILEGKTPLVLVGSKSSLLRKLPQMDAQSQMKRLAESKRWLFLYSDGTD